MKKAKFGTDFQNNRANYWLYEKYSFDLHPEISKNPEELLWPEITDVAKTDCRNLHEPAMKDKYIDLIEQTFDFPQDEFSVEDNELNFHDIPLMELIKQYGTPLKITYLPKISQQINRAKRMFNVAMAKVDYKGSYNYCYCTKSSHFSFVLEEAMKNDVHLETSSAYDIHIINALYDGGIIDKDRYIICNGFKRPQYVENIAQLVNDGFVNTIPVLDNKEELDLFEDAFTKKCKVGIRIACEEEPKFEFYTSRLGIRYNDIIDFYKAKLKNSKKFQLKMLHFFINTGIKDTAYYWNELSKCMNVYCELKAICPELDSLNIGGGFPIKNSLNFEYDYEYLTEEIIAQMLGESGFQAIKSRKPQDFDGLTPLLEVKDVTSKVIPEPLSFTVRPGEVVGLAGLKGAGRTEIFNVLFGIDPARSGEIRLDRKKLRVRQPCDAIRGGIFLVPENRHTQGLSLMHSVYDNSLLPLLPMLSKKRFFIDDRQGAQIVQEIIETMQVKTPGSDIAISKLSGGNQQKIVVGKALESHPKILLLDDPTYGVDIHAKGDITAAITRFTDADGGVVFVSSELTEMIENCDRILLIKYNRIVGELRDVPRLGLTEDSLMAAIQ